MTDAEMVKAMEICKDKKIPCDDCPLVECGDCEGISRQYFYDRFKQLQSENAELKSSLTHANEECLKWHERAQNLLKDSSGSISGYEKKISDLQAENAALKERLEKVLELPVPLGTPVLKVWRNRVPTDDTRMDFVDMWEITTVSFKLEYYTLWGKQYFHNTEEGRKAAEARLEELKGEEKNG